ncbi:MAG: Ig-like domain-containing protein [Clostridia bacterium]|nr:Ig-like domain-containing protein [Clostridia bacterium]
MLVFNESDFVLMVGEQKRLTADGENLTWSSSDEKIATVDNDGLVTARAFGEAEITVKASEQSASCKVSVTAQYVPVLRIDATNKTMNVGDHYNFSYALTYQGEEITGKVRFFTADENVVRVSEKGELEALAIGTSTVFVEYSYLDFTDVITIDVSVVENVILELDIREATLCVVDGSETGLPTSVTANITQLWYGENTLDKTSVVWESADSSIVEVSNGEISAKQAGTTSVFAKYTTNNGTTASFEVAVEVQKGLKTLSEETVIVIDPDKIEEVTITPSEEYSEPVNNVIGLYNGENELISTNLNLLSSHLVRGENEMVMETAKWRYSFKVLLLHSHFSFEPNYKEGAINSSMNESAENKNTLSSAVFDGKNVLKLVSKITSHPAPYYSGCRLALNLETDQKGYIFFDMYIPKTDYSNTPNITFGLISEYGKSERATVVDGQYDATWIKFVDEMLLPTTMKTDAWNTVRIDMNDEALKNIKLQNDAFIELGVADLPDSNDVATGATQDGAAVYKIDPRTAYYGNFRFWLNEYYEKETTLEEVFIDETLTINLNDAPFAETYTVEWLSKLPIEQSEMYGIYDENNELLSRSLALPTAALKEGEWKMRIVALDKKAYVITANVQREWWTMSPSYRAGTRNAKNTLTQTTFDEKDVLAITTNVTVKTSAQAADPYYCGVRTSLNLTTETRGYILFNVYVPELEYSFTPVIKIGNESEYAKCKKSYIIDGQFNQSWISFVDANMQTITMQKNAWNTVCIDMNNETLSHIKLQSDTILELGAGDLPDSDDVATGATQDGMAVYTIDPRTAYYCDFRYISADCLKDQTSS